MLKGWNSLFQSKKYIGLNFLTLYQRKDTPFVLTHVKSGLWMHKVGHSHSRELDPEEQLQYLWLLKFLETNKSAFAFNVP
jgi:hypothetical protein